MKHKFVLFAVIALFISTLTFAFGIRVENASGTVPFTVNFSCAPSGGQSPYTYAWTFGDGGTSTEQNPQHTYTTAGTFNAQVAVTSTDNQVQTCSQQITANWPAVNVSCTANPTAGTAPLTVNFTSTPTGGSGSYTYDWNWGDATAHGNTKNPSHTYTSAGNFTATVTVTSGGLTNSCSKTINVTAPNHDPTIPSLTADSPIFSGDLSTIAGTTSDVDGDTVTWTLSISPSSTGSGTFTGPTSGTGNINSSLRGGNGGYVYVVAKADDGHGGTATRSVTIVVQ